MWSFALLSRMRKSIWHPQAGSLSASNRRAGADVEEINAHRWLERVSCLHEQTRSGREEILLRWWAPS